MHDLRMESSRPSFAAILAGRTLGDFVLEELVGEGGFGVVYRARQPRLGRLAVVKVLHMRLRAAGEATEPFLREARTASSLDHPYDERGLAMRHPHRGIAGFSADTPGGPAAEAGLIEGASGVGLALLAATTDLEPS